MAVGKKILSLILLASINVTAYSDTMKAPLESDPHRNELGFFDLHVCNWPDRPKFYKSLFSSTRFSDIAKMEIFMPDGKRLGQLNLNDYMRIEKKGKPEKRVFLNDIDVPEGAGTGWYESSMVYQSVSVIPTEPPGPPPPATTSGTVDSFCSSALMIMNGNSTWRPCGLL